MKKKKYNKSTFIRISIPLSLLCGFIVSIPFSIFLFLPYFEQLGPEPNKLIVFFVILPVFIIIGIFFGYIGLFICLLIWKPLLTEKDIDECIYKQILFRKGLIISKKDIRWFKKNILKRPWYLPMTVLIVIAFILDQIYRKIITTIFPQRKDMKP